MKITDLLKKESIALDVKVDSKGAAIDYLVDLMDKSGRLNDKEGYKKGILARACRTTSCCLPVCIQLSSPAFRTDEFCIPLSLLCRERLFPSGNMVNSW